MPSHFQVKLKNRWVDYDGQEDKIIKRAYMAGFPKAQFQVRGTCYEYHFGNDKRRMFQVNKETDKKRDIRPPRNMTAPEKPIVPPGPTTVVQVRPGWPGTQQVIPHPKVKGAFIAVNIPKNAKPGMTMLVPVPEVNESTKVAPEQLKKAGLTTGGKVAAGGVVVGVGGAIAAGGVLGLALGGVLGDDAAAVAGGVVGAAEGAAGDAAAWASPGLEAAGGWAAGAAADAGDWGGKAAEDAGGWLAGAGEGVGDWAEGAGINEGVEKAAGWAGGAAGEAAGWVGDAAGDAGDWAADMGEEAADFMIDAGEDVGDFIMDLMC
jgi:hypothetical protein